MSKLRDIINGVAVDGANTMGANITGIEPITPNTAEVRIKALIHELIRPFYTDAFNNCETDEQSMAYYSKWVELRQKVKEL